MTKKRIILLLSLPVVVFLLAEIGLRISKPAGNLPAIDATFTNDIPGVARVVQWQQQGTGLRSDGWPEGAAKILCVGSDNSAPMLQANKDTWWGVAGAELAAGGMKVATGTTGSQGVVVGNMLRWVRYLAPDLKPSVVVLSFGPGEVLYRPAGYRFEPNSLQTPLVFTPAGWKGSVLKTSEIARQWRMHRQASQIASQQADLGRDNALRDRMNAARAYWATAPMLMELPWVHNPADEVAECLREFASLAKEFHFAPLVVWEPWPQRPDMTAEQVQGFHRLTAIRVGDKQVAARVDPAWVDNRMKAFRMRAQAVAEGLGIPMVDASTAFDGSTGMFLDDTVWTDAGAKVIGKTVAPAIANILAKSSPKVAK